MKQGERVVTRSGDFRQRDYSKYLRRKHAHTLPEAALAIYEPDYDCDFAERTALLLDGHPPDQCAAIANVIDAAVFDAQRNEFSAALGETSCNVESCPIEEPEPTQEWLAEELAADLEHFITHLHDCTEAYAESTAAEILDGVSREELRRCADICLGVSTLLERKVMAMFVLFSRFWVRSPVSWRPKTGHHLFNNACRLAHHLFSIYDYPQNLIHAWFPRQGNTVPDVLWIEWFILAVQGGSILKSGRQRGWEVSATLLKHLAEGPSLWPQDAYFRAQLMSLGANEVEVRLLWRQPVFTSVLANPCGLPGRDPREREFCRETIAWMARHRDELATPDLPGLLRWAIHLHTEERRGAPVPDWRRWQPARVIAAVREHFAQLRVRHAALRWEALGWDWAWEDDHGRWTVNELASGEELYEEGQALDHCVSLYAPRCVVGDCAVFSFRRNGQRMLTVEVDPRSRRIVQARGHSNREATANEKSVFQRWMASWR